MVVHSAYLSLSEMVLPENIPAKSIPILNDHATFRETGSSVRALPPKPPRGARIVQGDFGQCNEARYMRIFRWRWRLADNCADYGPERTKRRWMDAAQRFPDLHESGH
jgi:hypothetical protein